MDNTLVYDVGMSTGDDTAYYLHKGYSVVAVEANPELVERGKSRFANEISSGRVVILNVGVAEADGELDFWVCPQNDVWSSFDRSRLLRYDVPHHSVRIRTRTFASIIDEFGVPFYCKVDIEGHDHVCIEQLTPDTKPRYISVEMTEGRWLDDLRGLKSLGYDAFKVIDQMTFRIPWKWSPVDAAAAIHPGLANVCGRVRTKVYWTRRPRVGDWSFPWALRGRSAKTRPGDGSTTGRRSVSAAGCSTEPRREMTPLWFDIHGAVKGP